jgi:hypothetical protein
LVFSAKHLIAGMTARVWWIQWLDYLWQGRSKKPYKVSEVKVVSGERIAKCFLRTAGNFAVLFHLSN